jgi:predicted acyltransferase
MAEKNLAAPRLASLDQFRGYTVLGMFVVNFVGSFAVIGEYLPLLKHHHTYCSYADTIMPQFFLAVGFAYRLTFLRRMEQDGAQAAYWHAIKRCLGLLLVALLVHTLGKGVARWDELFARPGWDALAAGLKRDFFQTLTHIAVTSLWIMPVIAARPSVRILFMLGSAVGFHLLSLWWYYDWVRAEPRGIDGGPLGFLTWTIPMIVGTLACDALLPASSAGEPAPRPPIGRLLAGGVLLMLVGYALSCLNRVTPPNSVSAADGWLAVLVEPPFMPPSQPVNVWTMSQRAGSVTYLTFGAGFSLALLAVFVLACDVGSLRVGIFRTLGTNALAGYILHELVSQALKPLVPKDSPLWFVALALGLFLTICYVLICYLERNRLFLKL